MCSLEDIRSIGVDELAWNVRRDEARALRKTGKHTALTTTRWILLKHRANLAPKRRARLRELVRINLATVCAYLLKEQLQHSCKYVLFCSECGARGSRTVALRT
ncbi:transposase [Sorangium sp. So ce117]|uniref:transposase n=1 Tax=Sorangium sp. So ce117 TaxID=3133277 RepID=UPI003F5ED194